MTLSGIEVTSVSQPAGVRGGERSTAIASSMVVLEPSRGWMSLKLGEFWRFRELLYFLVWRDVKVRYKQTAFGAAWAILQPVLTMVVFSVFFGALAQMPSEGLPYPVFTYAALLPWQLFAHAVTAAGNSLISNQALITKVYFPRLTIPVSAALAGLIDFCVAFLVLLGLMVFYHVLPTVRILAVPVLLLLVLGCALAVGLWLSALNVRYRDVRHTLPFLTQLWLFVSPVAYPASLVPEPWRLLYSCNPMVGVIEGFRWALLGTVACPAAALATSFVVVLVLLAGGLQYFRQVEATFADIV